MTARELAAKLLAHPYPDADMYIFDGNTGEFIALTGIATGTYTDVDEEHPEKYCVLEQEG